MSDNNLSLGRSGEELAAGFLKDNGYKVIKRNYKTKLGEIDIVALDKDTLCFIEVKTRNSGRFGSPLDALTRFKQKQIAKAALIFLKENKWLDKKARFDVVSVVDFTAPAKIELIKDAFELTKEFNY